MCVCVHTFYIHSVGFRTTPMDSNGVSHIMEHTVLTGSRRYPCREPFFKMLNCSLNTFMNALTCMNVVHVRTVMLHRCTYINRLLYVYLVYVTSLLAQRSELLCACSIRMYTVAVYQLCQYQHATLQTTVAITCFYCVTVLLQFCFVLCMFIYLFIYLVIYLLTLYLL